MNVPVASYEASRGLHPCTTFLVQIERFFSYAWFKFYRWPTQSNLILEVVKEPLWANAEPILLLPFSAQSYMDIIL